MTDSARPRRALALAGVLLVGCGAGVLLTLTLLPEGLAPADAKAESRRCRSLSLDECGRLARTAARCPETCAALQLGAEQEENDEPFDEEDARFVSGQFSHKCPAVGGDQFDCPNGAVAYWTSRAYRGRHNPPGVPADMKLPMGARLCLQACVSGIDIQREAQISCLADFSGQISSSSQCYASLPVWSHSFTLPLQHATFSSGYCCSHGYGWLLEQVSDTVYAYVNRDTSA